MVVKKNETDLRSYYQSHFGNVDEISHLFGIASHAKFYGQMVGWHSYVDGVLPDYFPFNTLQGFLQTIIDNTYSSQAQLHYDKGVDMGRQMVGKATQAYNDAVAKINQAVNDMKNLIQTQFINPLDAKVKQFTDQINAFTSKIGDMGITVDAFRSTINQAKTDAITALTNASNAVKQAADVQNRLDSAKATIDQNLQATANKLNEIVVDANKKAQTLSTIQQQAEASLAKINEMLSALNMHSTQINELYKKLNAQPSQNTQPIQPINLQESLLNIKNRIFR